MSATIYSGQVLASFQENEENEEEYKAENKLVFLALHALGRKTLRVITDGSRISFIYKKVEVEDDVNRILAGLTNGISESDDNTGIALLVRLLTAWTVWETFLNQMRDMNRPNTRKR